MKRFFNWLYTTGNGWLYIIYAFLIFWLFFFFGILIDLPVFAWVGVAVQLFISIPGKVIYENLNREK